MKNSTGYKKIKNAIDIKNIFSQILNMQYLEYFRIYCDLLNKYSLSAVFQKMEQITQKREGRDINELLTAFEKKAFPLSKEEII